MNLCIFEGHLTKDPELRTAPGPEGKDVSVLSFSIGVNTRRNRTSFPNLEAWAQGAETIHKWFKKGDLIRVYCEHITDSWTDKETGKQRYKDKFRVNNFDFPPINRGRDKGNEEDSPPAEEPEAGDKPTEAPETPSPAPATTRKPRTPKAGNTTPASKADDEDIPF